jgi:hypothetical protein
MKTAPLLFVSSILLLLSGCAVHHSGPVVYEHWDDEHSGHRSSGKHVSYKSHSYSQSYCSDSGHYHHNHCENGCLQRTVKIAQPLIYY